MTTHSSQGRRPAWEGVAVLCRGADGRSLLMVLQGQPHERPTWAVPGGTIEPGETPEGAVRREVWEETGLQVRRLRRHTIAQGTKAYGSYRVHYFVVESVDGKIQANDPEGLIHQVAWVSADELETLPLSHEDQRPILVSFASVGDEEGKAR